MWLWCVKSCEPARDLGDSIRCRFFTAAVSWWVRTPISSRAGWRSRASASGVWFATVTHWPRFSTNSALFHRRMGSAVMPDRGADAEGGDPRTGAQLTAALLADFGIDTVFGLPGGPILPLIDAIENHRLLRFVLTRHEEAAVFLAQGYVQASGRPAAVLVTAGPGATHALTAAASATSDYCPVLVL